MPVSTLYLGVGAVLLLAFLAGLFYYKWGGAARVVGGVNSTGTWSISANGLTSGGVLRAAWVYLGRIWLALVYGILIGAVIRAFVPVRRIVDMIESGGPVRRQLAGGAAGAPLMLCSCCITPVFASTYARGSRLSTALTLMFASPGLNPAALVLTFLLFPRSLALARLAAALVAVFLLPPVVQHVAGTPRRVNVAALTESADTGAVASSPGELVWLFARSVAYLTAVTVPLVLAGVLVSSVILPLSASLPTGGHVTAVLLLATVAVLIALPTFFEIPLALLLLQLGAPGAAAAMLVAGPLINLPSLLVLARETSTRVAVVVAVGIWTLAAGAGLLTI